MSRDYRKLKVFSLADSLTIEIYRITESFPKSELFGITSQMRRAAVSVPTNIVEGSHRQSGIEYIRFLDIALGSLAEVGYLFSLSNRLGYVDDATYISISAKHEQCIKMMKSLITNLRVELFHEEPVPKPKA